MAATDSKQQLLTISQAAMLLAVAPATLRKWRAQRRLPIVRLGRAVRVRLADIEAIIHDGLPRERERK